MVMLVFLGVKKGVIQQNNEGPPNDMTGQKRI